MPYQEYINIYKITVPATVSVRAKAEHSCAVLFMPTADTMLVFV